MICTTTAFTGLAVKTAKMGDLSIMYVKDLTHLLLAVTSTEHFTSLSNHFTLKVAIFRDEQFAAENLKYTKFFQGANVMLIA